MSYQLKNRYEKGSFGSKFKALGKGHEIARAISLVLLFFSGAQTIILSSWAADGILDYTLLNKVRESFPLHQACSKFGYKNRPLIEKASSFNIDCMGGIIDGRKFCRKVITQPQLFIRALIDEENQKIHCESAKRVSLKVDCSAKGLNQEYCFSAKGGCEKLQGTFAYSLDLEYSILGNSFLRCEYISNNFLEIPLMKSSYF